MFTFLVIAHPFSSLCHCSILSKDSNNHAFFPFPIAQTLLISSPVSLHREKVREDIRVSPAAFPSGHLINERQSTHTTQWERDGRWDVHRQNEKVRECERGRWVWRGRWGGGGLKRYHFSFADLKAVIYLITTIPSISQWFDIRSLTAPWPWSNPGKC